MHLKGKVLITDEVHPILLKGLQELGLACDYKPSIQPGMVKAVIHQYRGLIINSKILVDQSMIDASHKLWFIGRLGSGLEIIDLNYAAEKGIDVLNSPEGNCNAVAEHALGMLLSLSNHLCRSNQEVRNKIWRREANRGFEIQGKKIGIIGFGHTGSTFAKKMESLGVEVLAYDKYKTNYATNFSHVKESSMAQIFETADFVSLHLPLTEETHYLANRAFFEKFKKPIVLINTSRGKVVQLEDLLEMLNEGKVIAAGLDVFENEKPATYSPEEAMLYETLFQLNQVVLSPHVAGWTVESKERLAFILIKKIKRSLNVRISSNRL